MVSENKYKQGFKFWANAIILTYTIFELGRTLQTNDDFMSSKINWVNC